MTGPPPGNTAEPLVRALATNQQPILQRWSQFTRRLGESGFAISVYPHLRPEPDIRQITEAIVATLNEERSVLVIIPPDDPRRGDMFAGDAMGSVRNMLAMLGAKGRVAQVRLTPTTVLSGVAELRGAPVFHISDWKDFDSFLAWARRAGEEDSSTSSRPPATSAEALLVSSLSSFTLSPSAQSILDRAKAMTPPGGRYASLSTLAFLFAFTEVGRELNEANTTVNFIYRYLHREAGDTYDHLYRTTVQAWSEDSPPDIPVKDPPGSWVQAITANVQRLFDRAREIARATHVMRRSMVAPHREVAFFRNRDEIHPRHLFAALLTFDPAPGTRNNVIEKLNGLRIDVPALRRAFFEVVTTNTPEEDAEAWRTLLGVDAGAAAGAAPARAADPPPTPKTPALPSTAAADRLPRAYQVTFSQDQNETDKLNLTHEIDAFAYLITSTALKPPLSVGLFGEWGSGKSFFMDRLHDRIDELASEARRAEEAARRAAAGGPAPNAAPEDIKIHRHICQIKFNAWHYVEGNIWASLVENIFSNLQGALIDPAADAGARRAQQEDLQRQLGFAQQLKADLQARIDQIGAARDVAQEAVDKTEGMQGLTQSRLAVQAARDAWHEVKLLATQDESRLREMLRDAGFPDDAVDTPRKLYQVLQSIYTTGGWFRTQYGLLARTLAEPGKPRWRLWARLALLVVLAGAIGVVFWAMGAEVIGAVVAAVTPIALAAAQVTKWLGDQARGMSKLQAAAQPVVGYIETQLAAAETRKQQEVAKLQKELDSHKAAYLQARARLDELDQQIATLEAQKKALATDPDPTKVLAQFIEERAACTDYRRHLGITAMIRRDFEKLTELIASRSMQSRGGGPQTRSVDRIVLYIDDLDRCQPDKVVAVLEAIHLILAFKLFVVVVGVDARWVSRSLKARYGPLLAGRSRRRRPAARGTTPSPRTSATIASMTSAAPADEAQDRADEVASVIDARSREAGMAAAAVPEDYLEKIFHIPFRLRALQPGDAANLIEHLARARPEAPERGEPAAVRHAAEPGPVAAGPMPPAPPPKAPPGPSEKAAVAPGPATAPRFEAAGETDLDRQPDFDLQSGPEAQPGPEALADSGLASAASPKAPAGDIEPTNLVVTPVDAGVSALQFTSAEIEFMKSLAPVIGRSPRAVFRFVNCYRIHKAARPPSRIAQFEAGPADLHPVPEFEAAMLVLALVIGAPEIAGPMLSGLIHHPDPENAQLAQLIAEWDRDERIRREPDWAQRLAPFLHRYVKDAGIPRPVQAYRAAAAAVTRYSFRTGMMEDIGLLAPGV